MITSFFQPKTSKRKVSHTSKKDEGQISSKRTRVTSSDENQKIVSEPKPAVSNGTAVEELLSHLTEESWRQALKSHLSSASFASLSKFIASERKSKVIYPPEQDTFAALNLLPLDKVKVIIVGQDPYHQPNQGHGLAFSVRKGVTIPPSLRNIYKELLNNGDDENIYPTKMPTHGYLERWAKQGVLMLNTVLTVQRGQANSHAKKGWEQFTDEVIRVLVSSSQRSFVFLLWGKPASKKAELVISRYKRHSKHEIICTSHPSPLGATKTNSPFIGSKCFRRANAALEKMGLEGIDWNVDDSLGCDRKSGPLEVTI